MSDTSYRKGDFLLVPSEELANSSWGIPTFNTIEGAEKEFHSNDAGWDDWEEVLVIEVKKVFVKSGWKEAK